jgi:mRNA interferase RelE/StbE
VNSVWKIEFEPAAAKQLRKLDQPAVQRILRTLKRDISRHGDPRAFGEAMVGNWTGFWRYRIGTYRAIARIEDGIVTVFIVEIAHRREVYR